MASTPFAPLILRALSRKTPKAGPPFSSMLRAMASAPAPSARPLPLPRRISRFLISRPGIVSPTTEFLPTPPFPRDEFWSFRASPCRAHPSSARGFLSRPSMRFFSGWHRSRQSRPTHFPPHRGTWSPWTRSRDGWSPMASPGHRACAIQANMRCAAASSIFSRPAWGSRCGSIFSATRSNRSVPSILNHSARPASSARSISCR